MKRLAPEKILAISFASYILIMTFVLMIPQATKSGSIGFIDALFTITSATCVTGLTVVDTGTYFTDFGQAVILLSIQLGGIGIMTFSTFLLYVLGRRLTTRDASLLSTSLGSTNGTTARGLLWTVVIISITIEAIGAVFLYTRFGRDMPTNDAIWFSVFHSVSAFCNAGFGLLPDNLMSYVGNATVNITIMLLIILGGIGFIAFLEMQQFAKSRIRLFLEKAGFSKGSSYWREAPYRFSVHTKIVIKMSLWLIIIGAVVIGFLEFNNVQNGMSWTTRIYSSLFQSVTPRTAGFNTVDIGAMSGATLFVIMILMFIGASPGSTGGGIKTSTFAVLLGIVRTRLKRQDHVVFFGRRISTFLQSEAVTFTIIATAAVILGALLLQIFETGGEGHRVSGGKFIELLFEAISAFGTVGLSTGVTPKLAPLSKVVLIILMFVGRVGPLTLALAISRHRQPSKVTYPEGRIIIG
ncbi:MAG: potassium transporter TrkG [Candidatus Zixiibacteriota bacterium]